MGVLMTTADETIIYLIRTLHDLSKAINSTLDIDRVEEMILRKTSRLMGSAKVLILLLGEDKEALTIHNTFGFQPSELQTDRLNIFIPLMTVSCIKAVS